jgi:hypothetical protein
MSPPLVSFSRCDASVLYPVVPKGSLLGRHPIAEVVVALVEHRMGNRSQAIPKFPLLCDDALAVASGTVDVSMPRKIVQSAETRE